MGHRELLLEIGTEEIPAKFMGPALEQMERLARQALADHRIDFVSLATYGTPRRLVLYATGVAERQHDLMEEVKGPARKAAFDPDGNPTKAAQGFARSQGVAVEGLVVKSTPSGDYVFAIKKAVGMDSAQVLPGILSGVVLGLSFPKPMRWADKEFKFARPIRWILALYGRDVVPVAIADLEAGRNSFGHRFVADDPIMIDDPQRYFSQIRAAYVVVDPEERRRVIQEQLTGLAAAEGGKVESDDELLEEITFLVEYPTALCGGFDPEFLKLPREVLITPMKEHQRYFPVVDRNGGLLPKFISVRDGLPDYIEIVRIGNEKVLRARLEDARFFYEEDVKTPLADHVEKLKKVLYQENLGTVHDKVERVVRLSGFLTGCIGLKQADKETVEKASYLAKADLVTSMVFEFPELQGIMGSYYARAQGEREGVCSAIREHYLPRFAEDELPETPAGTVVSIADKMDTIVGCFAVGIQPTGSQDPYALRRQALGICRIILGHDLNLSLDRLITEAYQNYSGRIKAKLNQDETRKEVGEFFKQRIRNILADQGFRYDVVEAVLASGFDNLRSVQNRVEALADFMNRPEFAALVTAFTRAGNLARNLPASAGDVTVNPGLFADEVETRLYENLNQARKRVSEDLKRENYDQALRTIASLRDAIDHFFDGVMVMVDDPEIRQNRLGLLQQVSALVLPVADLSKISG